MNKFVFIALLTLCLSTALIDSLHGQTSGPGIISVSSDMNCPTLTGNQFPSETQCFSGTISCSNLYSIADIGFTFGVRGVGGSAGTIALFSHGDGTSLDFDSTFVESYNQQHFQTVEVVWQSSSGGPAPWEQSVNGTGGTPTVIKQAACRPATLLNWIFSHIYSTGGKCAEGISAGSAAIAYSMAQYDVNYLDAVEFHSGPPLSDISKGCVPPNFPNATVCSEGFCHSGPPGQTGEGSWMDTFKYSDGASGIDTWTSLPQPTCTQPNSFGPEYLNMSIVDGESDSTFHYPATAVSIWVCAPAGVSNSICLGSNPNPNNSAAEADYFADQIAMVGSARALNLYRVDQCSNDEDVGHGVVPAFYNNGVCPAGNATIASDMAKRCKPPSKHD